MGLYHFLVEYPLFGGHIPVGIPFITWRNLERFAYNLYYARQMRDSHRTVDIHGPCLVHGGGNFSTGGRVVIRSTASRRVELYCVAGARLSLGTGCFLNQGVHIACCQKVSIGDGCLLGDEVLIMDSDFHSVGQSPPKTEPVILEPDVWVGARAIILKGVTVGEGAVVGAGAVVTHSIPPRSLAVGNPARVVRQW